MSHFFAYLARMKFIQRWGLMRNTQPENIQEHSLQVATIAHALAVIKNILFDGGLDASRVAVLALYHDVSEVITGDLATPIKYFNPKIKMAYNEIENVANDKLLNMMPEPLQPEYRSLLRHEAGDEEHWAVVKAADKISAYLKCIEELKSGNREFVQAEKVIKRDLLNINRPEINYFLTTFIPSFSLTLDELN